MPKYFVSSSAKKKSLIFFLLFKIQIVVSDTGLQNELIMCHNEMCWCNDVKMELTWLHGGGLMNDCHLKKYMSNCYTTAGGPYIQLFPWVHHLVGKISKMCCRSNCLPKVCCKWREPMWSYIPIKIYAPEIQIIDLDNAGHSIESGTAEPRRD
jgi:hypothetical protein